MDLLSSEELQRPELDVGDWLLVPCMGAYTCVTSFTFNGFQPASICYAVGPAVRCWVGGGQRAEGLNSARRAGGRAVRV